MGSERAAWSLPQVCCKTEPLTEHQQSMKEGKTDTPEEVAATVKAAEKGRQLLIPETPPYFFSQASVGLRHMPW